MAGEKLTDRTLFSGVLTALDLIHVVDVSDVTQDVEGSSYELQLGQLMTFVNSNVANIYTADGTLAASRTVTMGSNSLTFASSATSTDVILDNTNVLGVAKLTFNTFSYASNINLDEVTGNFILVTSDSDIDIKAGGSNSIRNYTNNIERSIIDSAGKMGVGGAATNSRISVTLTENDFNHTVRASNLSGGNNAAASFAGFSDTSNVAFGVLGSNNTGFGTYGTGGDGFMRFNCENVNFVNIDDTRKYQFFSHISGAAGSPTMVITNLAVGIGIASPNASAVLDLVSTTSGLLLPRMTTAQKNAIASPVNGLVVYDTTLAKACLYTTAWETITSI